MGLPAGKGIDPLALLRDSGIIVDDPDEVEERLTTDAGSAQPVTGPELRARWRDLKSRFRVSADN